MVGKTIDEVSETLGIEFTEFQRKTRKEKNQTRKNLYQKGTILAIPLLDEDNRLNGRYGLAIVRHCNWLATMILYLFEESFDHVPDISEINTVSDQNIWFWVRTGDTMIVTEKWPVIGTLPDWNEDEWRETLTAPWKYPGYMTRHSCEPFKRMRQEKIVMPESEIPTNWFLDNFTATGVMTSMSSCHNDNLAPWNKPVNTGEYTKTFRKFAERNLRALEQERQANS